ncbi:MAG: cupredoxin domain-containing protein [Candidatus Magasanikbacteria bacterium]|nr:cupredoxin domain-containing protein [Candidatus Magasanikbacteria bacterium]
MKKIFLSLGVLLIAGVGCNSTNKVYNNTQPVDESKTQVETTIPVLDTTQVSDEVVVEPTQPVVEPTQAVNNAVVVALSGKNFEFSQKEISVTKGQKVTINFESTSGFHDWTIDEFNARTEQVNSGEKTSVTFTADKAGEFEYYCSVGEHRKIGMIGKFIVTEANVEVSKTGESSAVDVEADGSLGIIIAK